MSTGPALSFAISEAARLRQTLAVIKSLAHVCIKTRDLARTSDFYSAALGLTKQFDFVREGKVIGFYLKTANETFLEVFLDENVEGAAAPMLHHFCFETDALSDLHRSLTERGFAPGEIIMGADRASQFWVNDPNGVAIEFQEYSEQSSQKTGRDVRLN